MIILDDNKFTEKLLNEIKHIEYGLKHYIDYTKTLETELNFYKNAYENRVNESLKGNK